MHPLFSADAIRNYVRTWKLPRPLILFLFGFDPVRPENEVAALQVAPETSGAVLSEDPKPKKTGPPKFSEEEIFQRIAEWQHRLTSYMTILSLDDLARETGVTRAQLNHYFKQHLHVDFRFWVLKDKIRFSEELLEKQRDSTIKEVARQAGFNNVSNFHRQFKRITGKTPKQWQDEV